MEGLQTVREVFSEYLKDEQEIEEFASWAFGSYYRELDQAINFMETWNYLHSKLLNLEPGGVITTDAPKMIQVWKDNK